MRGGQIVLLDQHDPQAAAGGVAGDAGAVDAAADDREIEVSHCVPLVPMIEISRRPALASNARIGDDPGGMDFRDRHIVVTGGAGALGTAVVEALAGAGAICHVPCLHEAEKRSCRLQESKKSRSRSPAIWPTRRP